MSNINRPPVWQMVKAAALELSGELTYQAIKTKVRSMYGDDVNDSSITCAIISGAVNHPSRVHYGENKKPRLCDTPYDYLFSVGRGRVVLYNPNDQGTWEIAQAADGSLAVRCPDVIGEDYPEATEALVGNDDTYGKFALEAHLRDYLAKKLPRLPGHDQPLELYQSNDRDGVEFQTDVGPIDILATSSGDFYVIELKVGRGPDAALGQILRYMGWVKKHLAGVNDVYGIVIASDISQKLQYAATQVPHVLLMEYDLAVALRPVALQS